MVWTRYAWLVFACGCVAEPFLDEEGEASTDNAAGESGDDGQEEGGRDYVWVEWMNHREPCGGTVAYLDGAFEAMTHALGGEPEGAHIRYFWIELGDEIPCSSPRGCYRRGDDGTAEIYIDSAVSLHELAHAAHDHLLPRSRSLLMEGLAQRFDSLSPYRDNKVDYTRWSSDMDEWLTWSAGVSHTDDWWGYELAWWLATAMLERADMGTFLAYWHDVPEDASAQEMRAAVELHYDVTLEGLLMGAEEAGSCSRTWCFWRDPTPFEDGIWRLEPASCASGEVFGPDSGEAILREGVFEVETSRDLAINVDGEIDSVDIRSCDTPCDSADHRYRKSTVPGTLTLTPGRYVLTSRAWETVGVTPLVELRDLGPAGQFD